jgi:ribosome modulation factor
MLKKRETLERAFMEFYQNDQNYIEEQEDEA